MESASYITRRTSRQIMVGDIPVGGNAPISVQSMTNTETCDVNSTLEQVGRLAAAGADIVRVSVPTMDAAGAFKVIRSQVEIPLVADIHFDYRIALKVLDQGVDCLRINPGNIGSEDRIRSVVDSAKDKGIPIRIGVNAGSLGKALLRKYKEPNAAAMIESALYQIAILDKMNFQNFKISLKASEIPMTIKAYRGLAEQIDAPFHLGITEAGGQRAGTVKSAIGLGALLMDGIGDTIRVSLAADPVEEVKVGFDILKSLGLRHRGVNLVACPSCSRQNFDVISVVNELEMRLEDITTPIDVAVIGCIVNGPGEAKIAELGLTGASPSNLVYVEGRPDHKISNEDLVDEFEAMIRQRVADKKSAEDLASSSHPDADGIIATA
ncbi:MAG: flavodoxin-dependent (E)-4-hydroxy-3-methylbut-2-enyl-diphosphate synthase [Gammaproteobacteria bacterium]|nr:4-hydroxy-3-methylbut-2-en-1-yl diphosphate synthase [Gammaproteobacteria bacterium]MDP6094819.1 flavodoxin-dependent (E)-4-hydroxy-3-methylbut-2-enyl-diphosphate synthase [Gammaproteobacteria bacterium]MDP7455437.1 flavodoxin-dependent (E)-4-hydroxy-3-methylbut-2-enyl-diphosphate synthase [Gammaproteobacteria bacterium]HJO10983.1 flavodoxin-dependent (E)-4-hydroxy-3-methylbut-2-enyl-diphosphate synthase [Gammaproteobacteria bacterium]